MFVKVALHFFYSSTFHKSFVVFLKRFVSFFSLCNFQGAVGNIR